MSDPGLMAVADAIAAGEIECDPTPRTCDGCGEWFYDVELHPTWCAECFYTRLPPPPIDEALGAGLRP